ncbi:MAG: GlxA family transcriptional regulator, partial [Rubrivivax sp.]
MTPPVRRIGLLLEPGFPLLALAGVVDSLEAANELQGEARYRAEALSSSGGHVTALGGVQVQTVSAAPLADWHAVFIIAAEPTPPDAPA